MRKFIDLGMTCVVVVAVVVVVVVVVDDDDDVVVVTILLVLLLRVLLLKSHLPSSIILNIYNHSRSLSWLSKLFFSESYLFRGVTPRNFSNVCFV